ncbi:hypothetical protein IFM89_006364, partial [Coptis chinensis]
IEETQEVFDSISEKNLISWNAMISGYAQNGQGTKAAAFFESMLKSSLAPDHISYVAVLSGCSHSGLVIEGKQYFDSMTKDQDLTHCAVKHLFELDPKHSGSYVLLANLYADSGNLNALSDVRKLMRERGIRKNPGCS